MARVANKSDGVLVGALQVVWCAVVFGHGRPSHGAVGQAAALCSVA